MKRSIAVVIFAILILSWGSAQVLSTLRARDARSMGLGGVFVATSAGYDSLYGNPAAAASPKGQFTLADLCVWTYLKPTTANISKLLTLTGGGGDSAAIAGAANDLIVGNGFGGGFSLGLGYVGKGFSLGMYAIGDAIARGDSALGATVTGEASINGVIGLAFPLDLGGGSVLRIGGDMRPFFRADSVEGGWLFSDFLSAFTGGGNPAAVLLDEKVDGGFGLAMDIGAQLVTGSFSFGLAVRDLSPSFVTAQESLGQFLTDLSSGTIPDLSSGKADVMMPAVYLGMAWKPRLIPGYLEPGFYLEAQDPVAIAMNKDSFWKLIHAGIDLRLLSFISLQAGFNEGWLSAGMGVDLRFLVLNAAVFTEEEGSHPGDSPQTGVSLQASIRF